MVDVEKVWEDGARILFLVNDAYLYECVRKVGEPDASLLKRVNDSWFEFLRLNPPF